MLFLDRESSRMAIAVVGLACRFPGARDVGEYWANLLAGVDSVTAVPEERFTAMSMGGGSQTGAACATVSRHGGFLSDVFAFDAEFFGVAPSEAVAMDPQQRILLQVSWEALENAGIAPSRLAGGRTGVFVGQATAEYAERVEALSECDLSSVVGGRLRTMTAGRISYALDARGPSLVVDTACSSSLVAVHLARQSLESGESDLAIVGGVNVILSPRDAVAYSRASMLAPDGRCKFADERADGFVRSEGVGAVILKRLPDALRDGDLVHAVIAGSAVTNDGRGSKLLLKPAVSGQADMLLSACSSAGISPAELTYVEAHGTGTPTGDLVELTALHEMCADRDPRRPLRVGSVKSNIGHCEAAAGIAGLIKTVLIARHGLIPPSLHVERQHPLLAGADSPIRVVTRAEPLDADGRDYLGVSSFGLSGTNAHVVVEPYRAPVADLTVPRDGLRPHLLVLSARSQTSLRALALRYAEFLRPGGHGHGFALEDICAAAALTRDHHPYRLWAAGTGHAEIADRLDALAAGREHPDAGTAEPEFGPAPRLVFTFPGQGSQWSGMAGELLAAFPAFAKAMGECDAAVQDELGWSPIELIQRRDEPFPEDVDIVQPTLWAVQVALAALWRDLGVEPDVFLGHSMGECAAATAAGALSVRDAASVICRRSRLMSLQSGRGAMLATDLTGAQAEQLVSTSSGRICIAARNAPSFTVLAGDPDELGSFAERHEISGGLARFVKVAVASHSPDMDPLRQPLLAQLASIEPKSADGCLFSTVRAEPIEGTELDNRYWMDNLRHPVRFAESVRAAAEDAPCVFLEISPHPLLVQAVDQCLEELGGTRPAVSSLRRDCPQALEITRSAGRLYALGAEIDWARWHRLGRAIRSDVFEVLPRYPWSARHFKGQEACPEAPVPARVFEQPLDIKALSITSRRGRSVPVLVYAEAVLRAARGLLPGRPHLRDVEPTTEPLDPAFADGATLRVELHALANDLAATVSLRRAGTPTRTCLRAVVTFTEAVLEEPESLDETLEHCVDYMDAAQFRAEVAERGLAIPPAYRGVERLWRRRGVVVASVRPGESHDATTLETLVLPVLAALPGRGAAAQDTYLPVHIDSIEHDMEAVDLTQPLWAVARARPAPEAGEFLAEVSIRSSEGSRIVARLRGIRLLKLAPEAEQPLQPVPRVTAVPPNRELPPVETPAGLGTGQPRRTRTDPESVSGGDLLVRHAANLLGLAPEELDRRRTLRDLGLDSLMAVRLRDRLRADIDTLVSVPQLLGDESIATLASGV